MTYANNKGAGQPAHPRSLISAFVVRCLHHIIPLDSTCISEMSRLCLTSEAAQAGLSLPWSKTRKTGFLVTRLIELVSVCLCVVYYWFHVLQLCLLVREEGCPDNVPRWRLFLLISHICTTHT